MTSRIALGVLATLIVYFTYHAFAGEQGLGAWTDLQVKIEALETRKAALEAERDRLEADIARLDPDNPDPDFVATLAREQQGYVLPGELVIRVD